MSGDGENTTGVGVVQSKPNKPVYIYKIMAKLIRNVIEWQKGGT
jgi:hypothetical protein